MPVTRATRFPERIVSLQPSVTVTLARLGAIDRVVACTKYCLDVCPDAGQGRHIVADSWSAKSKEFLAAQPDLVIASVPYQLDAVAEILKAGVRFIGLAPRTLKDIYADIAMIAAIIGESAAGEQMIARMQRETEAVRQKVRDVERVLVFAEEWGKPIIASQQWVAELIEMCGGKLVATPGAQCTAENIATKDPEVILAAWCGAGDRVPLEKIVRSRGWENVKAVRNGRVFCIRDEYLNTPAVTLLDGLRALAWAIQPELFTRPAGIRQIGDKADIKKHSYALMERR
jgi:iron complex transport system substrate-binding protein